MAQVSNEEYLQRWEDAAPTPVDTMTEEEIKKAQGTRNSEAAPWETYDQEFGGDDPALLEAMAEYASRVSDAESSSQTKEELARLKEGSDNAAQEYQWVSPAEYKNEGERIGHIMHACRFLDNLRKAGVNCWYRTHPQAGKITLVVQRQALPAEVGCWCMAGFAPELSIMRFDIHGVPTVEKFRGWRTCLLQLILKGVISEKKAEEVFGKPPVTRAFHRYNSTLQKFRNAGSRLED
jgi:hypothetical protein